jgi:CubicO group peptidase (beta-lactamase class C family)
MAAAMASPHPQRHLRTVRRTIRRTVLPLALGALVVFLGLGALGGLRRARDPAEPPWRNGSHGEVHGAMGAALDGYLRRLEAFGFSGSVLVARQGQILLDAGYGYADEERGEPYLATTQFDIASVSKQFTAAAILELEREGRLRVEDALARFFPAAPPDKAVITLHQLLTHTAGLPYLLGAEYERLPRAEMLRRVFATPLLLPPGRRFRYSNVGYSLLAAVAEVASGQPLGDLMRERLFLPAGMRHTGFRLPFWDHRQLAHGYSPDGPWGTPLDHPWADDGPYWNLRGNGGVISTTGDLYRWHLALAAGTVLSAAEREKYQTPHISEGPSTPSHYAYGWSITAAPDGSRLASHTGGNGVFETDFRRYLDDRMVLVASSNRADYSAVAVAGHLENLLFGQPDPRPPEPVRLPPEQLRRCAGVYTLASGERLRVRAADGGLRITADAPATLGMLLATQDADERELMAGRDQKVGAALAGAMHADFTALADLFGAPAERVARPFHATMNLFVHQLGAWTGSSVLGSSSIGGYPYTYARLNFEHGTRLAQYRWDGPTVGTVRFPAEPLAYLFLPEHRAWPPGALGAPGDGALAFGAYDARTGAVQSLRCLLPPSGQALSLEVETPAARVPLLWASGAR